MAHIPALVTEQQIVMACGKIVAIPTKLQGRISVGNYANTCLNPEDADCPTCNCYITT